MPFLKWEKITFCIDSTPTEELLAINGFWEKRSPVFFMSVNPGRLSCSSGQFYTHVHLGKHQLELVGYKKFY